MQCFTRLVGVLTFGLMSWHVSRPLCRLGRGPAVPPPYQGTRGGPRPPELLASGAYGRAAFYRVTSRFEDLYVPQGRDGVRGRRGHHGPTQRRPAPRPPDDRVGSAQRRPAPAGRYGRLADVRLGGRAPLGSTFRVTPRRLASWCGVTRGAGQHLTSRSHDHRTGDGDRDVAITSTGLRATIGDEAAPLEDEKERS